MQKASMVLSVIGPEISIEEGRGEMRVSFYLDALVLLLRMFLLMWLIYLNVL